MLRFVLAVGLVAAASNASLLGGNPFQAGDGFVPRERKGRDGFMEPNNDLVRAPNRRHSGGVDHGEGFVPSNPNQPKQLEQGTTGRWPKGMIPKDGYEFFMWAQDNKINAQEWPPIQEPWR